MKNDRYRKARGGWSRVLDITCEHCGAHVCNYQKDGPGILKRIYLDRILDSKPEQKVFVCASCRSVLGEYIIYKKENRPAYRLYAGAVEKKIVKK